MTSLLPPREVADPRLWMRGYRLRLTHRPVPGGDLCPGCTRPWPCPAYDAALAVLRRAASRWRPVHPLGPRHLGSGRLPL